MRVLLCPEGTRGDVDPLLALGTVLREAGHSVRLCAPPGFENVSRRRGFDFRSSGLDVVQALSDHSAAIVGGGLRLIAAQHLLSKRLLANSFAPTIAAAADADCILAAGVQLAAATAAELADIPYRYIAYTPALIPSREHAPALVPNPLPRWAEQLAWRAMPLLSSPLLRGINRHRRTYSLAPARHPFAHIFGAAPILLAADPALAPAPADSEFAIDVIGALLADAEGPLPEKITRFLDAGPPPVYFGFGSMTDPDPTATTRILLDAVERAGCRALVSQGWAGLGSGPLPETVLPIGEVSHTRLFRRVAAVVHHGGAGTTARAARAGAPQLVVPHLLDQHYFARRVHALGIAPQPVRRRHLCAETLGDALGALLDNEIMAHRAERLGKQLRSNDPLAPQRREALLEKILPS
jgi:vancomycin aglycone glucosyltransferase